MAWASRRSPRTRPRPGCGAPYATRRVPAWRAPVGCRIICSTRREGARATAHAPMTRSGAARRPAGPCTSPGGGPSRRLPWFLPGRRGRDGSRQRVPTRHGQPLVVVGDLERLAPEQRVASLVVVHLDLQGPAAEAEAKSEPGEPLRQAWGEAERPVVVAHPAEARD